MSMRVIGVMMTVAPTMTRMVTTRTTALTTALLM